MRNIKSAILAILAKNTTAFVISKNPPTLLGSGDRMKGLHFRIWIIQKEESKTMTLASSSATRILQEKQKCKSTGNFHGNVDSSYRSVLIVPCLGLLGRAPPTSRVSPAAIDTERWSLQQDSWCKTQLGKWKHRVAGPRGYECVRCGARVKVTEAVFILDAGSANGGLDSSSIRTWSSANARPIGSRSGNNPL